MLAPDKMRETEYYSKAKQKRERTLFTIITELVYCERKENWVSRGGKGERRERKSTYLVRLLGRLADLLHNGRSDTVEVTLTVDGDAATSTGGILLQDVDFFKSLQDLALDCVSDVSRGIWGLVSARMIVE